MELFAQILGYIGMALVVVSFLFKNITVVRIVNIVGSVLSTAFAFILLGISRDVNSFLPTGLLNSALIIVNVTMLFSSKKTKSN